MNTVPFQAPASAALHFTVSLNEEHTFLRVAWGRDREIDLGERVHHYSLLTLARQRLHDAGRGVDPSSQGWTEAAKLSRMLGVDPVHLNIQLHRARAQLARALPDGVRLPDLVERRRGELRLGALSFRIVRGSQLEGSCAVQAVIECNAA